MALDLSSLKKAVNSLERAIETSAKLSNGNIDKNTEELIRAGIIQNFEFTYELCWKFMQRWLEMNFPENSADKLTIKELFRAAAERGLIENIENWFDYHKKRNKTSHIYNETIAEDVHETSIRFLKDAVDFLNILEKKND